MSVDACPACGSTRLSDYPMSRRSGRRNFRCRDCGLAGWRDRDALPPVTVIGLDEIGVEERAAWFALKREGVVDSAWQEILDSLEERLGGASGHRVYDVGAGDGHFLAVARERGFDVGGNEVLAAAIEIARNDNDIDLDLGDLSDLGLADAADALTLWCVLAHVPDPHRLLQACHDTLRPGGVMYLQTPYRCAVDTTALAALRGTGGRFSRWVDRRIAQHHWILHTRRSMRAELERAGFIDVEVRPRARYSLRAAPYLHSLGLPESAAGRVGGAVDTLLDRGFAPRIVLDVFARKPYGPGAPRTVTPASEEVRQ